MPAPARTYRAYGLRLGLGRAFMILGVLVCLFFVLFPIVWMAMASFRPTTETLGSPPVWIPQEITFVAYGELFEDRQEIGYFINTYVIAFGTAFLCIVLGSLCAYGFSRFRLRGAQFFLLAILALQMIPYVAFIIPFFNISQALGIHDTYWALIIANTAFTLPIAIWLLKGFFDSIPAALEESAMIDGCTRLQALWYVVVPLSLPGVVGTAVFAFLWAWNEFLLAVVLTAGPEVAPLTIRISQFFTQFGRDWTGVMALNVVASVPLLVAFIFVQRWVIQGLTAGAVK